MKIVERCNIIKNGEFPRSGEWDLACMEVGRAVQETDWPHGSGIFTIYPESGKKRGEGNGVKLIKKPCLERLRTLGWQIESLPQLERGVLKTGDLDALKRTSAGYVGFEWETGNISSSHRAVNKLLLTLMVGGIKGGFLVVPSDRLKPYLTDRIGNIGELRHYFPLWESTDIRDGCLQIIVVEHDAESFDVPRIPKGSNGRAVS